MSTIGLGLLFVVALLGLTILPLAGSADTCGYAEDAAVFPNPERGWFVFHELKPVEENVNQWATGALLDEYLAQGYRLAKHIVHLPTNRDRLPQEFLDQLQSEADLFRARGFKVIYRFNYNWDHSVSNDDAPTDVTLMHLDQLEPSFARNKDVIFAIEMGFIGYWGEMHHSTHGHNARGSGLSESGRAIVRKMLEVLPKDRCVSLRYPKTIYRDPREYGSLGFTAPLNDDTAYNGSDQSRVGSWFANFGAGDILYHRDGEFCAKWAPDTRYVPQWAHCDHFEDVTMNPREWMDDAIAFHYRALSNPKDELTTRDIYEAWVETGTYDEFAKRLGYRYRLLESEVDDRVSAGGAVHVRLRVRNDGWGRPVNPRMLEVVFRNVSTGAECIQAVTPPRDSRLWFPDAQTEATILFEVSIATNLPAGQYRVLLNLPDPEVALRRDPRYSIRLASMWQGVTVWESETGYNRLGNAIEVTRSSFKTGGGDC